MAGCEPVDHLKWRMVSDAVHFLHVCIAQAWQEADPLSGMPITICIQLALECANQPLTNSIGLWMTDSSGDVNNPESLQHGGELSLKFRAIVTGDICWSAISAKPMIMQHACHVLRRLSGDCNEFSSLCVK